MSVLSARINPFAEIPVVPIQNIHRLATVRQSMALNRHNIGAHVTSELPCETLRVLVVIGFDIALLM